MKNLLVICDVKDEHFEEYWSFNIHPGIPSVVPWFQAHRLPKQIIKISYLHSNLLFISASLNGIEPFSFIATFHLNINDNSQVIK